MFKVFIVLVFLLFSFASCSEKLESINVKLPDCTMTINNQYTITEGYKSLRIKSKNFTKNSYLVFFLDEKTKDLPYIYLEEYNTSKIESQKGHLKMVTVEDNLNNTEMIFVIGESFFIMHIPDKVDSGELLRMIDSCNKTWKY